MANNKQRDKQRATSIGTKKTAKNRNGDPIYAKLWTATYVPLRSTSVAINTELINANKAYFDLF